MDHELWISTSFLPQLMEWNEWSLHNPLSLFERWDSSLELALAPLLILSRVTSLFFSLTLTQLPSLSYHPRSQGSNATGDCCSKCWNDLRKNKEGGDVCQPAVAAASVSTTTASSKDGGSPAPPPSADVKMDDVVAKPEPMDVVVAPGGEQQSESKTEEAVTEAEKQPTSPVKKKKKKKKGYKNLLADMMKESGDRDAEKEKDTIKKVTGGGAFVKIDKI